MLRFVVASLVVVRTKGPTHTNPLLQSSRLRKKPGLRIWHNYHNEDERQQHAKAEEPTRSDYLLSRKSDQGYCSGHECIEGVDVPHELDIEPRNSCPVLRPLYRPIGRDQIYRRERYRPDHHSSEEHRTVGKYLSWIIPTPTWLLLPRLQWRDCPRGKIGLLSCCCWVDGKDADLLTAWIGGIFEILEHDIDGILPTS